MLCVRKGLKKGLTDLFKFCGVGSQSLLFLAFEHGTIRGGPEIVITRAVEQPHGAARFRLSALDDREFNLPRGAPPFVLDVECCLPLVIQEIDRVILSRDNIISVIFQIAGSVQGVQVRGAVVIRAVERGDPDYRHVAAFCSCCLPEPVDIII